MKFKMHERQNQLIDSIPKIKNGQKFVLAIDGLSRSGKTTLAINLSEFTVL